MTSPYSVFNMIERETVLPVVVVENKPQAIGLANAILEGGINAIEITLRNTFGLEAISLVKKQFPEMVVLAGTVNSKDDMLRATSAGADAIVSPGATAETLTTALKENIPYLPGVATPSEILNVMSYGLKECKLFPASVVGGVSALKAYSGPLAEVDFCPTGGISERNFRDYLALDNVKCVGGSWVAPSAMIRDQDWASITRLCRNLET